MKTQGDEEIYKKIIVTPSLFKFLKSIDKHDGYIADRKVKRGPHTNQS